MTMICRKTMRVCDTPGMCSPFGGCSAAPPAPSAEPSERTPSAEHNFACSIRRGGECDCWYVQPTSECTTCAAPPATTTEHTPCGEDAGTESAVPDYAAIIESTLGAWKDHQRSVKWLLSQCEEYQRRAHAAEMALLESRLEAQKAAVGLRWWRR